MQSGPNTAADPVGLPPRQRGAPVRWLAGHTFTPSWLPERWRHPFVGYLMAVLLQGVAVAVVVLLAEVSYGFAFPALLSLLVVALAALTWGLGPSLLATLIGALLLGLLLRSNVLHLYENTAGRLVALTLFLAAAACLSVLASYVERARRSAHLLARVAEQAREDAQVQAGRLDAAFEAIADGIYLCDVDARLLRTNAAYRSLFGFDERPDELVRPLDERTAWGRPRDATGAALPPDAWPVARVLRGETLTGGRTVELRADTLTGEERELDVSGAPVRDAAGAIVGGVLALRDVTDRRQVERRTREVLQALLETARTLVPAASEAVDQSAATALAGQRLVDLTRRALDCHGVGLLALDPETGTLHPLAVAAPSAENARRWSAQANGTPLDVYQGLAAAGRLRAGDVLVRDRRHDRTPGHEALGGRALLLAPLRIGDGLVGLLHVEDGDTSHAVDERALVAAIAGLAALVIERGRLQGVRAEVARLAELDRLRGDFIASVSHELQTPLTAVRAGLGLLEIGLGGGLGPDERELLAATRRNVERLRLRLRINDLLAANRLEAGVVNPGRAPLDLRRTVTDALAAVQPLLQEKGQAVALDLPEPLPVAGDPALVEQVVLNLLANAGRHTPAGTRITVSGRVAMGETRLTVRDTGPGIPAAALDSIFEPFHRLDETAGGSGLGLAIARRLIELHGGRLWADSEGGQGAAFHIALPALSGDATRDAS